MKKDLHPTYHSDVKVSCACGNSFVTGSTAQSIDIEICSNCHPFFTGKGKILDAAGRVDKFKERIERAKAVQAVRGQKPTKGKLVEETETQNEDKETVNEE